MACYVFGAGEYYGLRNRPTQDDYVIAADGGYAICEREGITPDLLLGDFDSLQQRPDFANTIQVPVEKDDTDTMLALKHGLSLGHREFEIYGCTGGRLDHTIANLQSLVWLARRGAAGWLYDRTAVYTAIHNSTLRLPARENGLLSVFCLTEPAEGVSIVGGKYSLENGTMTGEFPLGVSNHFIGNEISVTVEQGTLIIGMDDED